jgi:hypothetical protein
MILGLTFCLLAYWLSFTCMLGGIGASFRRYLYKGWFTTKVLMPSEHYIPLAEGLSSLNETFLWMRTNATQVRDVATKGLEFYLDYLSCPSNQKNTSILYPMTLVYESKGILTVS